LISARGLAHDLPLNVTEAGIADGRGAECGPLANASVDVAVYDQQRFQSV
jgi:hypothetical protein